MVPRRAALCRGSESTGKRLQGAVCRGRPCTGRNQPDAPVPANAGGSKPMLVCLWPAPGSRGGRMDGWSSRAALRCRNEHILLGHPALHAQPGCVRGGSVAASRGMIASCCCMPEMAHGWASWMQPAGTRSSVTVCPMPYPCPPALPSCRHGQTWQEAWWCVFQCSKCSWPSGLWLVPSIPLVDPCASPNAHQAAGKRSVAGGGPAVRGRHA